MSLKKKVKLKNKSIDKIYFDNDVIKLTASHLYSEQQGSKVVKFV